MDTIKEEEEEAGPSATNQEEEEEPTPGPMDIVPYNPPKDRGPVYS